MLYLNNNIVPNRFGLVGGRPPKEDQDTSKAKGETPQPIIPTNPSTSTTSPTGTNSDLAKFFKPETASKHKNTHHK
jgi:hypothetical protein